MSKYKQIQTQFKNIESLKAALLDIGFTADQLELAPDVHHSTLVMYGYHGDARPERASLRIDRKFIGSVSNDVGFAWDGQQFVAMISEFDNSTHFNGQRQNALKQSYAKHEIKRQARLRGYSVNEQRRTDGTIALTLVRR